jgi:hypothetical protein
MYPSPAHHSLRPWSAHASATDAFSVLGVDDATDARTEAERELSRAARCRCCVSARVHLGKYVGSTLFLDDNPQLLHSSLPPADRARFTMRTVAACIVLYGRPRVELYERH